MSTRSSREFAHLLTAIKQGHHNIVRYLAELCGRTLVTAEDNLAIITACNALDMHISLSNQMKAQQTISQQTISQQTISQQTNSQHANPLQWAAFERLGDARAAIIQALVTHGADMHVGGSERVLQVAIRARCRPLVSYLLHRGARLLVMDSYIPQCVIETGDVFLVDTVWHACNDPVRARAHAFLEAAAIENHLSMLVYLLTMHDTNNTDSSATDKNYAALVARQFGNLEIAELLDPGSTTPTPTPTTLDEDPDSDPHAVLRCRLALQNPDTDTSRLIRTWVTMASSSWLRHEVFHLAAELNSLDILRYLLQQCGVDVHYKHELALRIAVDNNQTCMVTFLVGDAGADVRAVIGWLLRSLMRTGNLEMLHYLAHRSDIDLRHLLSTREVPPKSTTRATHDGDTRDVVVPESIAPIDTERLLRIAVQFNHVHMVEYIASQCGVNMSTMSPAIMHIALENENCDMVACLLRYGYDVHAHNDNALRVAVQRGYTRIVACLLEHGANVNVCSSAPLRQAILHKYKHIIVALLEHGATIGRYESQHPYNSTCHQLGDTGHNRRFRLFVSDLYQTLLAAQRTHQQILRSRRLATAAADKLCAICSDDETKGHWHIVYPCSNGHVFHARCLETWLRIRRECPVCREHVPRTL